MDSLFIQKTTDAVGNVNDYNGEVSGKTFSSELVHESPIPFFVGSPGLSNDVNRHFQGDFINNFNSAIETAQTKLMGNISKLKDNTAELKQNTNNAMVGEIEFLSGELTAKINL